MTNANTPPQPSDSPSPHAVDLDLARLSLAGARFDDAAGQFTAIIRVDPECPEAWFGLGISRLLGATNLPAGFSEAMMAFAQARSLAGSDKSTVDISIGRAAIDYYGRLGDVILGLNQAMRSAQNNLVCGVGLGALSVVLGSSSHARYFQQTLGVIGTVSGAGIAAAAMHGHGNAAQTKAFVQSHMDDVRRQLFGVYHLDAQRMSELTDAFSRIDRLVFPERFRVPTPAKAAHGPIVYDPKELYRLTDKAVFFGVCAGLAQCTKVPASLLRIMPFLFIASSALLGSAILWSQSRADPNPDAGPIVFLFGGACFAIPAACLIGAIYLILGLGVRKLDSRTIPKVRNERTVQPEALKALMAAPSSAVPKPDSRRNTADRY